MSEGQDKYNRGLDGAEAVIGDGEGRSVGGAIAV